jgi:hypothetical protein
VLFTPFALLLRGVFWLWLSMQTLCMCLTPSKTMQSDKRLISLVNWQGFPSALDLKLCIWELQTVLMAAFLSSTGVILTPMSIVFFKLQHLHFTFLVLWIISKQACRLAGLSICWAHLVVASPYPCCSLKAVGKNLNGFDCLEGWWGAMCYWTRKSSCEEEVGFRQGWL